MIARRLLDLAPSVFLLRLPRRTCAGTRGCTWARSSARAAALVEVADDASWVRVRAAASPGGRRRRRAAGHGPAPGAHGRAGAGRSPCCGVRRDRGIPVVAVDIPSGVPSDSGRARLGRGGGRADRHLRRAEVRSRAAARPATTWATLIVADIGIPASVIAADLAVAVARGGGGRREGLSAARRAAPTRAPSATCWWWRARWGRRARPSCPRAARSSPGRGWSRWRRPRRHCRWSRRAGRS